MFKFTIRDLLWLTVVAALAVGWWTNDLERRKAVNRADQYLKASLEYKRKVSAEANMHLQKVLEELNFPLPPNPSASAQNPPKK